MIRLRPRRARHVAIDELIPPKKRLPPYTRKGDFKKAGAGFLETAIDKGLKPDHRVLDLGCGVGRFAVAASGYLDERGRYVGLDTDKESISICNEWIAAKLPQFTFVWADVFSTLYNPSAEAKAARYKLPFEDNAFDFVFSNSLFTHLVPDDARNYFHEIGRVLKPGGRTLNSIFLLNEESLALVGDGTSRHGVLHPLNSVARVKDPDKPEAWIGLDEEFVRKAHISAALRIDDVRYGAWSGRESTGPGFGKKDIILAVKEPGENAEQ
jgi:SAM-dependent methyltransferase